MGNHVIDQDDCSPRNGGRPSAALLMVGVTGVAHADPAAAPLPINGLQAPGLPAVQSLGPGHPAGGR